MIVSQCPICGRHPKIKEKGLYCVAVYVSCQNWFGKTHIQAMASAQFKHRAEEEAIGLWNKKCDDYLRMKHRSEYNKEES